MRERFGAGSAGDSVRPRRLSGATFATVPKEPWFNPPGGTWVPNSALVSAMKADFDEAIGPMLAAKVPASAPPVQYGFQYQGAGSGSSRTILLYGHPFPVPSRAQPNPRLERTVRRGRLRRERRGQCALATLIRRHRAAAQPHR